MEKQAVFKINGQAVKIQDLALMGETGALADDRVFAELLRLAPESGGVVARAIMPPGFNGVANLPLVGSSGSADAKTRVHPFRAIIGSRAGLTTDLKKNYRDIRSVLHVGSGVLPYKEFTHTAIAASTARWDLIYATVSIDAVTETRDRAVKAFDEAVSVQNIPAVTETTVLVSLLAGTPIGGGDDPTPPDVPPDSGSSYHIPLAYVLINGGGGGFTAATQVLPTAIREIAPVACGAMELRPVSFNSKDAPNDDVSEGARNLSFMPSTMAGGAQRMVALDIGTGRTLETGTHILDDSIDWRDRLIMFHAQGRTAGSGGRFAWTEPPIVNTSGPPGMLSPGVLHPENSGMTNSMYTEVTSQTFMTFRSITWGDLIDAGSRIDLKVNPTTGNLEVTVFGGTAEFSIFIWFLLSAPWVNHR